MLDRLNTDRRCPDCGAGDFQLGPRGGLAINVRCAGCGAKFWFCPPFTPQRIDNEDALYGQVVWLPDTPTAGTD